ncbi:MAG: arsenate reductase (glutaredoxin) [Wenzhouxiangella sp.]|nr:MAG: arsenate reductase (glutaredoxin) [Wenzhouxiangella sp.]
MTPSIYHNPRCSKSRQALALLRERGFEPDIIEYLKQPPEKEQLRELIDLLGIRPRALLRSGETEYRQLGLANPELDDDALLQAMCEHPRLIERPIVIHRRQARIGRPPETILEIL